MDTEKLQHLKSLTQNLSVIYVEDSKTLQKQVGRFLTKVFSKFYQAYDGKEGLKEYIKYEPDIVITDLTMPKKNGLEMIVDIKDINPEVKIVVISAHNDDETLFNVIDLGIIDFIQKPIDLDKLTNSLISSIEIDNNEINNIQRCLIDLNIIKEQSARVEFVNTYKGMPIQSEGRVVEIKNNQIIAKVSFMQLVALRYEKHTVMELKSINRHIKVEVLSIDENNNTITLLSPYYINFTMKEFKYKRLKIDPHFKIGLHHKNKLLNAKAIDISSISLSMYCDDVKNQMKLNDEVDLTLGMEVKNISNSNDKAFMKIFVKGKIIKLEKTKKGLLTVVSLKMKKADENTLHKYLKQRELEIVHEFKSMIKE